MEKNHYFCNGVEIAKEEARKIDLENQRLSSSPNKEDWAKIRIITMVKEKE